MDEFVRPPTAWRERASEYLAMSKSVDDLRLQEQYAELAARYLDMAELAARYLDLAEGLEDEAATPAILSAGPKQK
jgi:hypothetical protein